MNMQAGRGIFTGCVCGGRAGHDKYRKNRN